MKLNNKGFGTKEMIIFSCIIVFLLLFVDILIHSMLKNFEDDEPSISSEPVISEHVVDTAYYFAKENELKAATLNYIEDHEIDFSSIKKISIEELESQRYISKIYDSSGKYMCSGYSTIKENGDDYDVVSYISCNDYMTEGY